MKCVTVIIMIIFVSGMEDYKHVQNLHILSSACDKMLREKFSITLAEDKMYSLIEGVSKDVLTEYASMQLQAHQLNNITLSKIKNMYLIQQQQTLQQPKQNLAVQQQPSQPIQESPTKQHTQDTNTVSNVVHALDDDVISHKLKELEARRKIIPNYSCLNENHEEIYESATPQQNIIYKANPISITLPSINDKIHYKNFIINSINRDWARNVQRNNIKFNISIDVYANTFYPQCICFPGFVKNITPYVLMNISDNTKNIFYSFTCDNKMYQDSKWDTWYPVEDVENISLQNKSWSIKFYDFMNNELDLGSDNMSVLEVSSKKEKEYTLKILLDAHSYDNNFKINDIMCIRTYNGKTYNKKIINYIKAERDSDQVNEMTIIDDNNELVIDDFINSKILNTKNQYSFIIKYCFNKV